MHNITLSSVKEVVEFDNRALPPVTVGLAVMLVLIVVLVVGFNFYDKKRLVASNIAFRTEDRFDEAPEIETGRRAEDSDDMDITDSMPLKDGVEMSCG
ncbi:hypothetical protein BDZ45DRAFT_749196 [Acephala macrosclerotiorum]|nr:hypothetical protein BDZ45DRAFT_749196 [Acephala macrosclerotiorum]